MPDHKFNIYSGLLKAYEAEGQKRLKTVASSTIRDRSGDVMTEKAIRKMAESAKDNLTIFLNHSYRVPEDVFGSVEGVAVVQRGMDVWDLDFDIRLNESNERAVKTYEAIQNGTKLGTSIGAAIVENGYTKDKSTGGIIFDDVELLEASIVGIPANPRSWVQYARKSLVDLEEEEESVTIKTAGGGEVTVSGDAAALEKAKVWIDVNEKGAVSTAVDTDAPAEAKGDKKKDAEPEVTKASDKKDDEATPEMQTVPGEDDPAHVENNEAVGDPGNTTPTAQEGQATDPESADDKDETKKALVPDAVKAEDFVSLVDMLRTTTGELVKARQAQVDAETARARAEEELQEFRKELERAKEIVETIANLPIGRRAVVQHHVNDFRTRYGSVYGDDFVKMLENKEDA